MEKEKLKQLRIAFKNILDKYCGNHFYDFTLEDMIAELLYEVKIRIK